MNIKKGKFETESPGVTVGVVGANAGLQVLVGCIRLCRAATGSHSAQAHVNFSHPRCSGSPGRSDLNICFLLFRSRGNISLTACGSVCKSPHASTSGLLWLGHLISAFSAYRNVNSFLLNTLKKFLRSSFTYVLYYPCFCFSWFILPSHNLPLSPSLTRLIES